MPDQPTPAPGYTPAKPELLKRLRRIEGQVRGIQRMVEADRYCIDILEQAAAVTAAMDRVSLQLLDGHVNHCMAEGAGDEARRQEMSAEMMAAMGRLLR